MGFWLRGSREPGPGSLPGFVGPFADGFSIVLASWLHRCSADSPRLVSSRKDGLYFLRGPHTALGDLAASSSLGKFGSLVSSRSRASSIDEGLGCYPEHVKFRTCRAGAPRGTLGCVLGSRGKARKEVGRHKSMGEASQRLPGREAGLSGAVGRSPGRYSPLGAPPAPCIRPAGPVVSHPGPSPHVCALSPHPHQLMSLCLLRPSPLKHVGAVSFCQFLISGKLTMDRGMYYKLGWREGAIATWENFFRTER